MSYFGASIGGQAYECLLRFSITMNSILSLCFQIRETERIQIRHGMMSRPNNCRNQTSESASRDRARSVAFRERDHLSRVDSIRACETKIHMRNNLCQMIGERSSGYLSLFDFELLSTSVAKPPQNFKLCAK